MCVKTGMDPHMHHVIWSKEGCTTTNLLPVSPSEIIFTCPKSISLWSLCNVLPTMQTCLVAESLEVFHDLSHVLYRHDDQ